MNQTFVKLIKHSYYKDVQGTKQIKDNNQYIYFFFVTIFL